MDITYVVKKGPKQYLTTFDPGRKADRWGPKGIDFVGGRALILARQFAAKHGATVKRKVPKGMTWGVQVLFDADRRDAVLEQLNKHPFVTNVAPAYPRQAEVPLVYVRIRENREQRLRDAVDDFKAIPGVKTAGLELVPRVGATPLEVVKYREQTGKFLPTPPVGQLHLVKP